MDVWEYIQRENIPVVPLYFAKEREMLVRGDSPHSAGSPDRPAAGREAAARDVPDEIAGLYLLHRRDSVYGSTVAEIIEELKFFRRSERENRVIDHDQEGSMELKKREGYF